MVEARGGKRFSYAPLAFADLFTKRVHAGRRGSLNCLSGVANSILLLDARAIVGSERFSTNQTVGRGRKFLGPGLGGMVCPSGAGGRLAPVARARARRGLA